MFWARTLAVLCLASGLIWTFAPRESAVLATEPVDLPPDLEAWVAAKEAGIAENMAGRIVWNRDAGAKTELALVYIHGFSGHPTELDPVPQEVAASVGANLYKPRLAGHGGSDADLAAVHAGDWWKDVTEAVAVAERLGDKVILIGLSTGGTLAALAAIDPQLGARIDAVVLISPNFGVKHPLARVLDLPYSRQLVRLFVDRTDCGDGAADNGEGGFMAPCPAIEAALPMADLVRQARKADFASANQPAFFIWSYQDSVVSPRKTYRVATEWGGQVTRLNVTPGKQDDPFAHMIAGREFSPRLSPLMAQAIALWVGQQVEYENATAAAP